MDDVSDPPSYFRYWGKAKKELDQAGVGYHLLVYHCLDVAAVGWLLLAPEKPLCQSLTKQLNAKPEWLQSWFTFCLALHDIGKFCRAFQNLAPNLSDRLVSYAPQYVYGKRHDTLGFTLWQKVLNKILVDVIPPSVSRPMNSWMEIVCGHHGQPPEKTIRTMKPYMLEEDECAAENFVREVLNFWDPDFTPLESIEVNNFRRVSWQLAGLAVLADWLGSNQDIFEYVDTEIPLENYWKNTALKLAQRAIEKSEIGQLEINPFQSIKQQFNFIDQSTPLQEFVGKVDIIDSQQLFILEDVTGAGKTEASMVLVHRLMVAGLANGVYVGLPTMATANAMYQRMAKSYRHLYADSTLPSLVLSHGARHLSKEFKESIDFKQSVSLTEQLSDKNYQSEDLSASAYCNQWLADSRKKALLADVGVGTIDQALLGILPARHQSLRLLGLTNKVLLVDEVHAFDPYMRRLLAALLQAHAAQGGSAILLSATLPYNFRAELVSAYAQGANFMAEKPMQRDAYPLVTQLNNAGITENPVATRKSVQRKVNVQRLNDEDEAQKIIDESVAQGRCVCWVRNTVKDALQTYQSLIDQNEIKPEKITLFHSRFAMIDRQTIEADVLERFGKSSMSENRTGQVLIATQVVEQSLDLDFDVMISDLAPIDLLIQRAGRLQRHIRNSKGDPLANDSAVEEREAPCLYVLSPDPKRVEDKNWLQSVLPGTQAVYSHVGELWLSMRVLLEKNGFAMPEDARHLIESVYSDESSQDIPEVLEQASNEAEAKQRAQHGMGEFNRLKLEKGYTRNSAGQGGGWDEDVRIPTRLGNDSVPVVLIKPKGNGWVPYADGEENAWALSQLSLPKGEWERVSKLVPPGIQDDIENLKRDIPALRWLEIVPLSAEFQSLYNVESGWGQNNAEKERV